MYKLFEDFRRSLAEADMDPNIPGIQHKRPKFHIIQTEAIVVMSKKKKMLVTDFLSRIRSVEGVTIVRAEETIEEKNYNITRLKIKIDAEYLPDDSDYAIKERVRSQVLSIPGILRFTYVQNTVQPK